MSATARTATVGGRVHTLSSRAKDRAFYVLAAIIVGTSLWLYGVSFGMDGPINKWWGYKWRKSWNIYI